MSDEARRLLATERMRRYRRRKALGAEQGKFLCPPDLASRMEAKGINWRDEESMFEFIEDAVDAGA